MISLVGLPLFGYHESLAAKRPALTASPRFEENYSFLRSPHTDQDFFDPIKYVSFGPDPMPYLSFGGEVRERYEAFIKNPLFGITRLKSDTYLLHRSLVHVDAHFSESFRSFIQLGFHDVKGKRGTVTATERSKTDIQQGFLEARWPGLKNKSMFVRVGRQEMPLGSQRLVSARDGPNIRQSFDAVRSTLTYGASKATFFIAHPVNIKQHSFDDDSDYSQDFWGAYLTTPVTGTLDSDIYYLGLHRKNARFAKGIETERRHSVGTRLFSATKTYDFNIEAVYQFGTFGVMRIQAWTFASDLGYSFSDTFLKPRLGLKANIASGDKNRKNNVLGTFNPLFPRGSYFTENSLVGPANFMDLQPNITLKLKKGLTLNFGSDVLWRQSTQDAIYRQPTVVVPGTSGKGKRYTGAQHFILSNWQINHHMTLTATYVYFKVSDAIKSVGGGDSQYLGAWANFKF
ncbi:MAG: alginate export family protein [Alphaproteobacteria bacterium]